VTACGISRSRWPRALPDTKTTERQCIGNQIESATIFARSDAFKTALYFGVFISTFATQFPITHILERLIKLAELPTRRPARHE
jgi:hypothetical protein